MADEQMGLVATGVALVWRRRSILWWLFAVNLALGALGTLPALRQLDRSLGHTLAGQQLYKGFDLGMFYELLRVPDVGLLRFRFTSYAFAALFALFMLFVSGGILESYRQDRKLDTGEFFSASGVFFWRFVQLTVFSLVPFGLVWAAYFDVERASDYLGDKATADQVGFGIWLFGVILLVVITLFIRLWFDIAKVYTVAQDTHLMLRSAWQGFDLTRRQIRGLFWVYLRISLVAWMTMLVVFLIWTRLPPTAIWASLALLELAVLVQLGARMCQLASVTTWYKRHYMTLLAQNIAAPGLQEVTEPAPQMTLYPEPDLLPPDD
jgi:hypothetical protein